MIKSLSQRDRYVLTGGAIALVLIFIVFGIILPYQKAIKRLENKIETSSAQLDEVRQLQAEYRILKKQTGRLKRDLDRREETPPLTFLEQTTSRIGGRENLVLMRPLPAVVQGPLRIETTEFKLEQLGLEQVLEILQEIEQSRPPMRVDRLYLKQRFDNSAQLDMSATISATRRN
jgi:general secretion pathway protein M